MHGIRSISATHNGTTLATYSVDGLGHRVTENENSTLTDVYFSSQWQVVEEDVSGSMTNQYVWSPVYVNAMIERDTPTQRLYVQQDANWNVTALVNTSGSVVERYVYDPYGSVTYLTASWGSRSGSNYAWHYLFQGGRLDTATGLVDFQHRDLSTSLGRWRGADPLSYRAGDVNLYRFVADSPGSATDPTGLAGPSPEDVLALYASVTVSWEPDDSKVPGKLGVAEAAFNSAFGQLGDAQKAINRAQKSLAAAIGAGNEANATIALNAYKAACSKFDGWLGAMEGQNFAIECWSAP